MFIPNDSGKKSYINNDNNHNNNINNNSNNNSYGNGTFLIIIKHLVETLNWPTWFT